jgi:hypothetical protein
MAMNKIFEGKLNDVTPPEIATMVKVMNLSSVDKIKAAMIKDYNKHLLSLPLEQLAETLARSSSGPAVADYTETHDKVYYIFVRHVAAMENVKYPTDTMDVVVNDILKIKCYQAKQNLSTESKKTLQAIAKAMGMDHFLSLSKKELCHAIVDEKTVREYENNKTLQSCQRGMSDLSHYNLDDMEDLASQRQGLVERMENLGKLVAQAKSSADFYNTNPDCSDKPGACVDKFKSLHEFAEKIRLDSETCNSEISKIKRGYKIGSLDENAGFFNRFRANYL